MADGVRYIKVAKIDKDGNDQTISLQSLSQIIIPYSTGKVTYEVLNITERPTYFTYFVQNPDIEWADRTDIEYDFTGSLLSNPSLPSTRIVSMSVETDNLSFYKEYTPSRNGLDPINGSQYYFSTYPQKVINIRVSGSIHTVSPSANISLRKNFENLGSQNISTGVTSSFEFIYTGSIFPGDTFFVYIADQSDPNKAPVYSFTSDTKFFVTSSIASGPTIETIPEPYFSENFSLAYDCQPTFNNAITNRKSALHQDIDYNTGLLNPTNFELLINGTALLADVQDSNYTSLRSIIPRYLGSKNQSEKLNEWTNSSLNIGTYGKLPSIDSLKTHVAYCDFIGGWPPERMGASGFHIRYLINENGDAIEPNTSPNSLEINQGTFETGERILISSPEPGTGPEDEYRTIIRGGTRIEPILYTQLGHSPASFTASINLENIDFISDQSSIGNYQVTSIPSTDNSLSSTPSAAEYDEIISQGAESSYDVVSPYGFRVTAGQISEGVDVNINTINGYSIANPSGLEFTIYTQIYINRGGGASFIEKAQETYTGTFNSGNINNNVNITIPVSDLQENDVIYVRHYREGNVSITHKRNLSYYIATQTPSPTNLTVTSTGDNTIWNYPDNINNLNVISCSNDTLTQQFDSKFIKQKDTPGSGFNTVSLPWSVRVGDEFRFEGREDRAYMVTKVYEPGNSSTDRIAPSASLEIHFDNNLPSQSINLDRFVVRRYINDAEYGLMEGFKPVGSQGPYIIRPEFITKKLDDNIDKYVRDLTEKGLL